MHSQVVRGVTGGVVECAGPLYSVANAVGGLLAFKNVGTYEQTPASWMPGGSLEDAWRNVRPTQFRPRMVRPTPALPRFGSRAVGPAASGGSVPKSLRTPWLAHAASRSTKKRKRITSSLIEIYVECQLRDAEGRIPRTIWLYPIARISGSD